VEVLTYHKANLAAEIEKLRAACERRTSHNGLLRMKLDVSLRLQPSHSALTYQQKGQYYLLVWQDAAHVKR
jgi:hypothetical protein